MNWKVIPFPWWATKPIYDDWPVQKVQRDLKPRVDYLLLGVDAIWFAFMTHILEWVYKNTMNSNGLWVNIDFMLRSEFHIQSCTIFECNRLLWIIDTYLKDTIIKKSPELNFFQNVRNLVFNRISKLKIEMNK
jgi:hypothetical protein